MLTHTRIVEKQRGKQENGGGGGLHTTNAFDEKKSDFSLFPFEGGTLHTRVGGRGYLRRPPPVTREEATHPECLFVVSVLSCGLLCGWHHRVEEEDEKEEEEMRWGNKEMPRALFCTEEEDGLIYLIGIIRPTRPHKWVT